MEVWLFIFLALAGGGSALFFFLFHQKRGQFEEMEDVKYTLFHEEEDA